jgi:hypothetical protein
MVTRRLRENSPRIHFRLVELPAFIAFAIPRLTSRRSASKKGGQSVIPIISKSVSYYAQIVTVVQYGRPTRPYSRTGGFYSSHATLSRMRRHCRTSGLRHGALHTPRFEIEAQTIGRLLDTNPPVGCRRPEPDLRDHISDHQIGAFGAARPGQDDVRRRVTTSLSNSARARHPRSRSSWRFVKA